MTTTFPINSTQVHGGSASPTTGHPSYMSAVMYTSAKEGAELVLCTNDRANSVQSLIATENAQELIHRCLNPDKAAFDLSLRKSLEVITEAAAFGDKWLLAAPEGVQIVHTRKDFEEAKQAARFGHSDRYQKGIQRDPGQKLHEFRIAASAVPSQGTSPLSSVPTSSDPVDGEVPTKLQSQLSDLFSSPHAFAPNLQSNRTQESTVPETPSKPHDHAFQPRSDRYPEDTTPKPSYLSIVCKKPIPGGPWVNSNLEFAITTDDFEGVRGMFKRLVPKIWSWSTTATGSQGEGVSKATLNRFMQAEVAAMETPNLRIRFAEEDTEFVTTADAYSEAKLQSGRDHFLRQAEGDQRVGEVLQCTVGDWRLSPEFGGPAY